MIIKVNCCVMLALRYREFKEYREHSEFNEYQEFKDMIAVQTLYLS